MGKIFYKNESEFFVHKEYKNEWGFVVDEVWVEHFYVKDFNLRLNLRDCCAYCYNSIPSFCRVQKDIVKEHHSWLEIINENSSILKHDNKEIDYNYTCLKVAWGACAYFFYTKRIDERGRSRYEWRNNEYSLAECRQTYFDICYEAYRELNLDDYNYYLKSIKNIDGFKSEFAKYHIEYEKLLINRTYATDIFEEYDRPLGIKQEAKEYLEWVRNTYLQLQTEVIETINRDAYLLKLFKGNEALYDKFLEQCKGKKGVGILIELSAVIIALECEDNYYGYLLTTSGNLATLHTELSKHFHLAKYPTFAKSLTSYKELPKGRKEKINVAKKEYQKILS